MKSEIIVLIVILFYFISFYFILFIYILSDCDKLFFFLKACPMLPCKKDSETYSKKIHFK